MSKMILVFLAIFAAVFAGIQAFVAASGREKLQLAKVLGYSLSCATLAIAIAVGVVVLF